MATCRRTVVIGGGIAGLSVAWHLALRRGRRVTLLEREPYLGTHSSGRNAQIWLPVDSDVTTGPLAVRSAELLTALLGTEDAWLRRSGAVVLIDDGAAAALLRGAERGGLRARRMRPSELAEVSPLAVDPGDGIAIAVEGAGIFEPHAMITALARAARAEGVDLRRGTGVRQILTQGRSVRGVLLEDGKTVPCDEVVLSNGAWAGGLARDIGATVPLVPLRRHLVLLEVDPRRAGTTVWKFGPQQVYWRPESGAVLASPCDEEPFEPCLPTADPKALERLAEVLAPAAPELVEAPVRTRWACLRTYANDRELVLGPDPRIEGLAWLAGLGGRGMTVGVAAGEACARAMDGAPGCYQEILQLSRPERPQPEELTRP